MSSLNPSARVVVIDISLDLNASFSLKDKRRIRQRLIERLKNRYNLSIIEASRQNDYECLELCASYVAIDQNTAEIMKERIHETILELSESEADLREFYAEIL